MRVVLLLDAPVEDAPEGVLSDEADLVQQSQPRHWLRALSAALLVVTLVSSIAFVSRSAPDRRAASSAHAPSAGFVNDGPLKAPRSYQRGRIRLLPPPAGVAPAISAARAFAIAGVGAAPLVPPVPTPHLVLAVATISDYGDIGSGQLRLFINHRLMWVVVLNDARLPQYGGGIEPAPRTPIVSGFALIFVDAATGEFTNTEAGWP